MSVYFFILWLLDIIVINEWSFHLYIFPVPNCVLCQSSKQHWENVKFMSMHILTDNCEKVFSPWHTVTATAGPASEQCKATHPVCVTGWPLRPLSPGRLSSPDWIFTTPLCRWPPFIWTDPAYQVCQF